MGSQFFATSSQRASDLLLKDFARKSTPLGSERTAVAAIQLRMRMRILLMRPKKFAGEF